MSGNGVTGCTRGDCISLRHEMCPNNKACYDSTCVGTRHFKKDSFKQDISKIHVDQHSVEVTPAAPLALSVGVWITRQSVRVPQVLIQSLSVFWDGYY